jgi:isoleucyl-tRNA synthetase
MAEVCITSSYEIREGEAPAGAFTLPDVKGVAVVIEQAVGTKCARSWKILPTVGEDREYPDVSPRDAMALREWKKLGVSVETAHPVEATVNPVEKPAPPSAPPQAIAPKVREEARPKIVALVTEPRAEKPVVASQPDKTEAVATTAEIKKAKTKKTGAAKPGKKTAAKKPAAAKTKKAAKKKKAAPAKSKAKAKKVAKAKKSVAAKAKAKKGAKSKKAAKAKTSGGKKSKTSKKRGKKARR